MIPPKVIKKRIFKKKKFFRSGRNRQFRDYRGTGHQLFYFWTFCPDFFTQNASINLDTGYWPKLKLPPPPSPPYLSFCEWDVCMCIYVHLLLTWVWNLLYILSISTWYFYTKWMNGPRNRILQTNLLPSHPSPLLFPLRVVTICSI